MKQKTINCAICPFKTGERLCRDENGKSPSFCPTAGKADLIERCLKDYEDPDTREFARQAAIQEAAGYANREKGYAHVRPAKPRIEEIIEFSQKMAYKRLGMAFCIGLAIEAKAVANLLANRGFDMVSVACKIGRIPKETIGVKDNQKVAVGQFESMCNPIAQAAVLNDENTDFNILLGLCVGHDSLFLKHANAPCTVLAVKDRLLGHNPLAAIYTLDTYYRDLK